MDNQLLFVKIELYRSLTGSRMRLILPYPMDYYELLAYVIHNYRQNPDSYWQIRRIFTEKDMETVKIA